MTYIRSPSPLVTYSGATNLLNHEAWKSHMYVVQSSCYVKNLISVFVKCIDSSSESWVKMDTHFLSS